MFSLVLQVMVTKILYELWLLNWQRMWLMRSFWFKSKFGVYLIYYIINTEPPHALIFNPLNLSLNWVVLWDCAKVIVIVTLLGKEEPDSLHTQLCKWTSQHDQKINPNNFHFHQLKLLNICRNFVMILYSSKNIGVILLKIKFIQLQIMNKV